MLRIPQRLARIFIELINNDNPVSITTLAQKLGVSNRTVFRELENADSMLQGTNLFLTTYVGEGLLLEGETQHKNEFLNVLLKDSGTAVNKTERRMALYLSLLNSTDWQKLFYYARQLDVSEATISLDLDFVRKKFETYNLKLLTRQGLGVNIEGDEDDIRHAIVSHITNTNPLEAYFTYPPSSVKSGVANVIRNLETPLNWITEDALYVFSCQLTVQVIRLLNHKTLCSDKIFIAEGLQAELSKKIADLLKAEFGISFSNAELHYIAKALRSARAKEKNPLEHENTESFLTAQTLAYRLIEEFDSKLGPILKSDEQLVRGLSLHLWSALVRIEGGYAIADPMGEQIKNKYPEIYKKAESATKVLFADKEISSGEISCIATYFGAAVMKIGQNHSGLKVCVVCMAGVGVSYMLAGQLRTHFGAALEIEVGKYSDNSKWDNYDILISTIDIDSANIPVVVVNPILDSTDYSLIENEIGNINAHNTIADLTDNSLKFGLENALPYLSEIEKIMADFKIMLVPGALSVEDFAEFVGEYFGKDDDKKAIITQDLLKRESVSSQLIDELSLVLLHAITNGVDTPVLSVLYPTVQPITNASGHNAKSCLLMLLPPHSHENLRNTLGQISASLIEDENFLLALHERNEKIIRDKTESIIKNQIKVYLEKLF